METSRGQIGVETGQLVTNRSGWWSLGQIKDSGWKRRWWHR